MYVRVCCIEEVSVMYDRSGLVSHEYDWCLCGLVIHYITYYIHQGYQKLYYMIIMLILTHLDLSYPYVC